VQLAAQRVLHLYGEASTADVIGGLTLYVPPRQAMYGTNTDTQLRMPQIAITS